MQSTVLNSMRVKVYKVRIYDIESDDFRISRRMATDVGAARMGGEIIPETGALISSDELDRGEQWTARDFVPSSSTSY